MKKGTSYIVVAAMMMGLMLTGCGGNDNSVTKATTEAETEAATEEQDTETQDTADDTEDSSVAIDEEDTEEDTEDSEEAEADPSIVGVYTKNGYENSYFGFKINLEGSYGIQTRGSLLTATDISEVVEDSNSDETVQRALDNLDNSFTVGNDYAFCANAFSYRQLESVVSECLVCLCHLVHVFFSLYRCTCVVSCIHDLLCKSLFHSLLTSCT